MGKPRRLKAPSRSGCIRMKLYSINSCIVGCGALTIGLMFTFAGEIGWAFGLPFFAAGGGLFAAAFTKP